MSEMTGPLAAAIRRPPCFSIRAAAAASIRAGILRLGRHLAGWAGILQADAGACPRAGQRPDPGAGFGELYEARRSPRPITEAACQAHGRRKFFVLADLRQGPLRGHSGGTGELRPFAASTRSSPASARSTVPGLSAWPERRA